MMDKETAIQSAAMEAGLGHPGNDVGRVYSWQPPGDQRLPVPVDSANTPGVPGAYTGLIQPSVL